jgi:hypothetical protein
MNIRILALTTGLCVLASAAAATAAPKSKTHPKKHTRTLSLAYSPGPTSHAAGGLGSAQVCPGALANCLTFTTARDEKYISLIATDDAGRPVGVSWYATAVGAVNSEFYACGSARNVDIAKGTDFSLAVDTVAADPSCPGVASTGSVTVVLSNTP